MKYAIVSSTPWSPSNRGMDILTEMLVVNNQEVRFVRFPVMPWSKPDKEKRVSIKVRGRQINYDDIICPFVGYVERYMSWIPDKIFGATKKIMNFTIPPISFRKDDVVVLESGKPLFLLERIPADKILIYRQSDPVELVLSKNNSYAILERKAIEKSLFTIVVSQKIFDWYVENYPALARKMIVSVNGFSTSECLSSNPYNKGTRNGIYVGYARIDSSVVNQLCRAFRFIDFHIIGKCISRSDLRTLGKLKNFHYHGNLHPVEYTPYISNADFAFVPYHSDLSVIRWSGLTSKYLIFMYYGLPIVSSIVGFQEEFEDLKVIFASSVDEFVRSVGKVVCSNFAKINYDINWERFCKQGRFKELTMIFKRFDLL